MERSDSAEAENVQPASAVDGLRRGERSTSDAQLSIADKSVQEILVILHKWGIHSLGQLAALDKEQLGARLGPEAVRLWERANGISTRLLKFIQPPESFEENFEFENEIETAQPLLFMLRRFLEQIAVRLSAIYLVARELTLRITFSNSRQVRHRTDSSDWRNEPAVAGKQSYERCFQIPQPTNDIDLLFRILQTHLENFKSEHPIIAVALTAQPIKPASQAGMLSGFETTVRNPQQLSETLARLSALLGSDRVGTPVLEETHRPDAFRIEPFSSTGFQPVGQAGVPACSITGRQDACLPHSHDGCATPGIALRRFRPPVTASIFISEKIPAFMQSEKARGKVSDQRGPYSLSGNWWDEKSWARTEWDLQLEEGEVVRAHESPPSRSYGVTGSTVGGGGTWKIDGVYD
jgi:protein ImuB